MTYLQECSTLRLSACVLSRFSHVWLFAVPWTVACQVPLYVGFSRQEYWSGLPCPLQGIFSTQRSNQCLLCLLHWHVDSLPLTIPEKPKEFTRIEQSSWYKGFVKQRLWSVLISELLFDKQTLYPGKQSIALTGEQFAKKSKLCFWIHSGILWSNKVMTWFYSTREERKKRKRNCSVVSDSWWLNGL